MKVMNEAQCVVCGRPAQLGSDACGWDCHPVAMHVARGMRRERAAIVAWLRSHGEDSREHIGDLARDVESGEYRRLKK